MAKDPAFLFFPGDWLGGTMLMTRHQKGCYKDLLMAQFNHGPLSLDQIKALLGQDQAVWTVLQEKFKTDNSGNYYNEKLAAEIEKRKKFVNSRSNNKSGRKKSYDKSCEKHMNHHMENRNGNRIKEEKGGMGEKEENIRDPFDHRPTNEEVERWFRGAGGTMEMAGKFINKYDATGWTMNGSKIINWTSLARNFISNYKQNNDKGSIKPTKKMREI